MESQGATQACQGMLRTMANAPATSTYTARRLTVPLNRPYDDAVRTFERLVPAADAASFFKLDTWDAVVRLMSEEAPHGFLRYQSLDISPFMATSGAAGECVVYLMGNHVIAERMYRHDHSVMLYAPLHLLIHADASGQAVFVIDQPSTLFASFHDPAITAVGHELDEKVSALLVALDAQPPAELA
ncbi:hypothetical protein [Actinopolymorpha pittospori]|uniref:DUF302 domain-containing protein n=1 Tax=Actinopolymorpha pittospori TaxID=648752 RepID=A0A927MPK8_9ACTN|nr:hypothetical protein [Actinopolymorpha pittospori]MBE1604344.1 hypothetical protein [Actinopolymorpha pittospori]